MKVFLLLFFTCSIGHAFSQIKEGYFQYSIDVEATDTLIKTKQAVGMLRNSKMELYFTPKKSRMNFKMGQVNEISIIVDLPKNKVLSLNSSMRGRYAAYSLVDDIVVPQKDSTIRVILSDERTKILGYDCKKAILIKDSVETIYWYTNEIEINGRTNPITNPNVPGFPMKFSKTQDGVLMIYEMSNIREQIENQDEIFSTDVPEGYQLSQTIK
jgi:GLPGLI family protein